MRARTAPAPQQNPRDLLLPSRPWTTWLPLGIVLGVSLIKEAIEDYKRYKADREVNNREVLVLNTATQAFEPKRWQDIHAGEIVEVTRDTYFPADLLFLTAENEEGVCYIETMNLDGWVPCMHGALCMHGAVWGGPEFSGEASARCMGLPGTFLRTRCATHAGSNIRAHLVCRPISVHARSELRR